MLSLVWNNAEGQPVIVTPNSRLLLALLAIFSLGVFVAVGLVLSVVGLVGYVLVQILISPLFLMLMVPAFFCLVCMVFIWWCAKYLWLSLFPRKVGVA